ncbi:MULTISPECIES: PepSY-associated TM helix domain-containing protein [Hydrocarboniphaga]|jgi:hypothetical protein|nr:MULTISPECIES: PepSY-associated TM helix domain-containing protein [Hydrocarboniphaga]MDZ4079996.1 PepSY-associated TM helix domain-containing protein [Hydrocarboniphaga sp.]
MSTMTSPKSPTPQPTKPRGVVGRLRHFSEQALSSRRQHTQARPKTNLSMTLRTWHKRIGLFAFVFMGWLGFSGFLINQSADWGYDVKPITASWVMALYGLHPEPPTKGYNVGGHWLAEAQDASMLDGKPLKMRISHQLGMAVAGSADKPLLFIAEPERVFVLSPTGDLVDEMSGYTLPAPQVRRIGTIPGNPSKVVIQDLDAYVTSDGLGWEKLPVNSPVEWAAPVDLPEAQRNAAMPFSLPSVTLEHVLVDAHSGRIFGIGGAWLINFVGLASMALSITGVWIIWRTNQQRKAARR